MSDLRNIAISEQVLIALNVAMRNSEAKSYSEFIGSLIRKNEYEQLSDDTSYQRRIFEETQRP